MGFLAVLITPLSCFAVPNSMRRSEKGLPCSKHPSRLVRATANGISVHPPFKPPPPRAKLITSSRPADTALPHSGRELTLRYRRPVGGEFPGLP